MSSNDGFHLSDDDMRLYIIGDIHGRLDLLDRTIAAITHDIAKDGQRNSITITVGDYIDRGPDSRGVLDRLCRNPFPTPYFAIKGNHEVMLEEFLQDPSVADRWRRFGGLETLHSYGIAVNKVRTGTGFEAAARALSAALPAAHHAFLASLKSYITGGEYFICHAGIRPGVPLDRQNVSDLFWIQDEFLNSDQNFGKIIIHGHSAHEWPEVRPNRINIDTGAFATGRLTCLVLEGGQSRFLFTA
jgi:calcineurin-like phosphoesterase family protein